MESKLTGTAALVSTPPVPLYRTCSRPPKFGVNGFTESLRQEVTPSGTCASAASSRVGWPPSSLA